MKKIAITGGIGSGKSFVGKYLTEKGYCVFSCDEIYRNILDTEEYVSLISSVFPFAVQDGKIDRNKLAETVFHDKEKLKILNGIAHPFILKKLNEEMEKVNAPFVFAEVPLLFEGGFEKNFDRIIVVLREKEKRIEAVRSRDGASKEQVLARMQNQFDYDKNLEELKRRYICIENNGDIESLYRAVDRALDLLL